MALFSRCIEIISLKKTLKKMIPAFGVFLKTDFLNNIKASQARLLCENMPVILA